MFVHGLKSFSEIQYALLQSVYDHRHVFGVQLDQHRVAPVALGHPGSRAGPAKRIEHGSASGAASQNAGGDQLRRKCGKVGAFVRFCGNGPDGTLVAILFRSNVLQIGGCSVFLVVATLVLATVFCRLGVAWVAVRRWLLNRISVVVVFRGL